MERIVPLSVQSSLKGNGQGLHNQLFPEKEGMRREIYKAIYEQSLPKAFKELNEEKLKLIKGFVESDKYSSDRHDFKGVLGFVNLSL